MTPLFEVKELKFAYRKDEPVLRGVSFSLAEGDFAAVTGPSGSGKSTLFYLLGALVSRFEGEIFFRGKAHRDVSESDKAAFRNHEIGFVFQQFYLLRRATVLENVLLPTYYPYDTSRPTDADRRRALDLLSRLGLSELSARMPHELSGGQQQRVAIARALIRDPSVILADEPTGNLDSRSAAMVMDTLNALHAEGKTVIIITHSDEIAGRCRRILRFKDGRIESDVRHSPAPEAGGGGRPRPAVKPSIGRIPLLPYFRALRPAWENIARTKTKAALTMLGVILGIAAVLTTMSLGTYAKQKILASYEALGVNNANITGYQNWRRSSREFSPSVFRAFSWERDVVPMMQIFGEIEMASPVITSWAPTFNHGGLSLTEDNTAALGVNERYYWITNQHLAEGRSFTGLDVDNANPVCVIGAKVKANLFPRTPPISSTITIVDSNQGGEIPCRVIGVLRPTPSQSEGISPDAQIYLPYSYLERALTTPWQREIREIRVKIHAGFDPDDVGKQIEGYLKSRYGNSGRFQANSNARVIEQMKLFLNVFSALLTAVAMIALLVGGVGINNMMLVNLSERLQELGLRKALGATPNQIRALVLTESVLLCGLGGIIGIISGFLGYQGLIYAATRLLPNMTYEWVIEPLAVISAFAAIVVTGILSGFVPAMRAEKLEVIEALRQDQ